MNTNRPYASLQEFAQLIAQALTNATEGVWTRSTRFDADDTKWRAEIDGPDSQRLFISNTWAGSNGRLYIGGSFPDGANLPYKAERPSITVADTKSAQQIANDIIRRLLPPYVALLAIVLANKAQSDAFEAGRKTLAQQVAEVVEGHVRGELVDSFGGWTLQVSGPESIRVTGHCNYLTLEQLKKIAQVCPELFRKAGN